MKGRGGRGRRGVRSSLGEKLHPCWVPPLSFSLWPLHDGHCAKLNGAKGVRDGLQENFQGLRRKKQSRDGGSRLLCHAGEGLANAFLRVQGGSGMFGAEMRGTQFQFTGHCHHQCDISKMGLGKLEQNKMNEMVEDGCAIPLQNTEPR